MYIKYDIMNWYMPWYSNLRIWYHRPKQFLVPLKCVEIHDIHGYISIQTVLGTPEMSQIPWYTNWYHENFHDISWSKNELSWSSNEICWSSNKLSDDFRPISWGMWDLLSTCRTRSDMGGLSLTAASGSEVLIQPSPCPSSTRATCLVSAAVQAC